MLTVALFAVAVPIVITIAFIALRGRLTRLTADNRGIALQTIIIIVVLLAIAGAVATVLLTRAGEETARLEEETDRWTDIDNFRGCEIANGHPAKKDYDPDNASASQYTSQKAANESEFNDCWPPLP